MPRGIFSDKLQSHCFWLFDASPIGTLSLPLFSPLAGFASCTMPEITLDTQDITEGNWYFKRQIVTGASIGNLTLTKGATFLDADFYRWTLAALHGDTRGVRFNEGIALEVGGPTPRRTLVLIQFFPRSPFNNPDHTAQAAGLGLTALGVAITALGNIESNPAALFRGAAGGAASVLGPFEAPRIPARAWLLQGCLPVRYKPGGDLDATDDSISMMELEIAVEQIEQVSLSS